MGRAGGGGGFSGGSSGGGFHGGSHHSGGGFSGGGSGFGRAGSSFSSNRPGSSGPGMGFGPGPGHGGIPRGNIFIGYGPYRRRSYIYDEPVYVRRRRPGRRSAFGSFFATVMILIMAVLVFFFVMSLLTFNSHNTYNSYGSSSASSSAYSIANSTIEREKLNSSNVNNTGYFYDGANMITNVAVLNSGMESFYDKTGVYPFIYVSDNIDGIYYPDDEEAVAEFAESYYETNIGDEAHFLYIFIDNQQIENAGYDYFDYYVIGDEARTVMDDEAIEIFRDYVAAYYQNVDKYPNYEDFLGASYKDAGNKIMHVTVNPWVYVLAIGGTFAIVFVGFKWWQKKREARVEEEKRTQEILNTPLETFGSSEAKERAKKYGDGDGTTTTV